MSASTRYAIVTAPVFTGDDLLALIDRPTETPLPPLTVRSAQYLEAMMAKPSGISAIEFPGQRLADGIFKLRRVGVEIETQHEPHAGAAPGFHARYRLKSRIVRLAAHAAVTTAITTEQRASL